MLMKIDESVVRGGVEVLIAEDSPTQAARLKYLLEKCGYGVMVAPNGKEALATAHKHKPDLIISDVMMPEMDGYSLCKQVKSDEKMKRIPIILLTSLSDPQEVIKGLQSGADNFITKPYDDEYLLSRIQDVLANHRLREREKADTGVEVLFAGQKYLINSERRQILDLLISTYEAAINKNIKLVNAQNELNKRNEELRNEITERKRVEAERERYFTLSIDMLCVAGMDGYFKRLNPAFERTLGFSNEELLSRPFLEFVHPEDRAATVAEVQKLATGAPVLHFENRYLCKNGSYRWLAWTSTPSVGEGLIYAAARDVTEQKRVQEEVRKLNEDLTHRTAELEAVNKELEAFSYSVSHDLRTPLRTIDGFSLALLEDYAGKLDTDGKDALQRVRTATQRMGELIDDLLSLSRVTRSEMRHETVDLSALAKAIVTELQKREPDRQVEFVIAPGLAADGDARLLRVVLDNLLGNAWKFTGKQPHARIEFGVTEHDSKPNYFVSDNGAGFDMAYADKLFGAFQRLHSTSEFSGTGIGLATVQRIIRRHGGSVWAEGAVGKGATFYFTL